MSYDSRKIDQHAEKDKTEYTGHLEKVFQNVSWKKIFGIPE